MPKAQIPEGYVKAVQHGQFGPASWVNVFYFLATPAGGATSAQVVADAAAFTTELYNKLDYGNLGTGWSTSYVTVLYHDAGGSLNRARVADANPGTAGGGVQDAQVCYLINWSADDARRGGKARQYVPGVPDSVMADTANIDAGILSSMNAGIAAWMAEGAAGFGANATVLDIVEMSFVDGKADRTTPVGIPINGGGVNPVVATQRRRVDRLRPQ